MACSAGQSCSSQGDFTQRQHSEYKRRDYLVRRHLYVPAFFDLEFEIT